MNSRWISPLSHTQSTAWNHRANTRHTPFSGANRWVGRQHKCRRADGHLAACSAKQSRKKEIQIKVGVFSKAVKLCSIPGLIRNLFTSQKKRPPPAGKCRFAPALRNWCLWYMVSTIWRNDPDLSGLDLCHWFSLKCIFLKNTENTLDTKIPLQPIEMAMVRQLCPRSCGGPWSRDPHCSMWTGPEGSCSPRRRTRARARLCWRTAAHGKWTCWSRGNFWEWWRNRWQVSQTEDNIHFPSPLRCFGRRG